MRMTPEQIAKECDDLGLDKNRAKRLIHKRFREQNDDNLWPICGRFSTIDRAIGRAKRFIAETGEPHDNLGYSLLLDSIMSEIVNNPRNW